MFRVDALVIGVLCKQVLLECASLLLAALVSLQSRLRSGADDLCEVEKNNKRRVGKNYSVDNGAISSTSFQILLLLNAHSDFP